MSKQEKLYTTKEIATKLKVSVQRVAQLVDKYIHKAEDIKLSDYVDYSQYKKKFKGATLKLLKSKQKANSKFQKIHP